MVDPLSYLQAQLAVFVAVCYALRTVKGKRVTLLLITYGT